MHRFVALLLTFIGVAGSARAGEPLSEERATAAAVAFIRGDSYGDSSISVASHLKEAQRITKGHDSCGTVEAPVWAFRFQTTLRGQRIDGWLHVDAMSGDIVCSSIPFLRVGG